MSSQAMNTERVACIKTDGYPASLVLNAVYGTLPDDDAAKHGLIRVIDESGEDYLYPAAYFIPVGETADLAGQEFRPPA